MSHPERRLPNGGRPLRPPVRRPKPVVPEWTSDELAPYDPAKWDRCRRCPHLRVEHAPNGRRCEVLLDASEVPTFGRCDCAGFDAPRPRRAVEQRIGTDGSEENTP